MHHAQTNLDPTEQTPMRYKLFATAIRGIGVAQIMCLQPYLQSRLEGTLHEHLDSVPKLNGMKLRQYYEGHANAMNRMDDGEIGSSHEVFGRGVARNVLFRRCVMLVFDFPFDHEES